MQIYVHEAHASAEYSFAVERNPDDYHLVHFVIRCVRLFPRLCMRCRQHAHCERNENKRSSRDWMQLPLNATLCLRTRCLDDQRRRPVLGREQACDAGQMPAAVLRPRGVLAPTNAHRNALPAALMSTSFPGPDGGVALSPQVPTALGPDGWSNAFRSDHTDAGWCNQSPAQLIRPG